MRPEVEPRPHPFAAPSGSRQPRLRVRGDTDDQNSCHAPIEIPDNKTHKRRKASQTPSLSSLLVGLLRARHGYPEIGKLNASETRCLPPDSTLC
jgi:hypothetical protein